MTLQDLIRQKNFEIARSVVEMDVEKTRLLHDVRDRLVKNERFVQYHASNHIEGIRKIAWQLMEELSVSEYRRLMLGPSEKAVLLENLMQLLFGLGVIEPYLNNSNISEIMVNGPNEIFYEQNGKMIQAMDRNGDPVRFLNEQELYHVIDKIVAPINRRVDQSSPIVDARLPNGSRVNVVLPPVSLTGPILTIRRFPDKPYTMAQLVDFGMLSEEVSKLLSILVQSKYNILIAGGTGSGKTTFLNALSNYIGSEERVVTVEDSAELKIHQIKNLVSLETRAVNIEGKGEISMRDLVRTALRMRPDRIVVGEVRGGEALDMLQAMNTGHDGSLTTGHANSSADMISRVETMVLMAGLDLPMLAIRKQIASAVDFIIFLKKQRDGKRLVTELVEVVGMADGEIILEPLLVYEEDDSTKDGIIAGSMKCHRQQITHSKKLLHAGFDEYSINNILKGEF